MVEMRNPDESRARAVAHEAKTMHNSEGIECAEIGSARPKSDARASTGSYATESVVIAHDYFTQKGGAERVAAQLIHEFKPHSVYTAVINHTATFPIEDQARIVTSPLQYFRPIREEPKLGFAALPFMWHLFPRVNADLLICSSSGWAHAARAAPFCYKVVYCHNPARWLYQSKDFFKDSPPALRYLARAAAPILRRWDARAAHSADLYLANSRSVASRIHEAYGITAQVLPPPVSLDPNGPQECIQGLSGPFFLSIARIRGYKNVKTLVDAFARMPQMTLVLVGQKGNGLAPNIRAVGRVNESQLRWLYANATALISVAHEDFGLTPLEANLFGTPALVLKAGGFLDTVVDGINGRFIKNGQVQSIVSAVMTMPTDWDDNAIKKHADLYRPRAFTERLRAIIDEARASDDSAMRARISNTRRNSTRG